MNQVAKPNLSDRITRVEQRLERRRARFLADAGEAVDAVADTSTKVLPVVAALGAGLAALWLLRRRSTPRTYSAWRAQQQAAPAARRGLRWAQIAGILGSAIRIGTSPQARSLWHNLRARRTRY
jgi:hypothetical protein